MMSASDINPTAVSWNRAHEHLADYFQMLDRVTPACTLLPRVLRKNMQNVQMNFQICCPDSCDGPMVPRVVSRRPLTSIMFVPAPPAMVLMCFGLPEEEHLAVLFGLRRLMNCCPAVLTDDSASDKAEPAAADGAEAERIADGLSEKLGKCSVSTLLIILQGV